jgi:hypothetical protein
MLQQITAVIVRLLLLPPLPSLLLLHLWRSGATTPLARWHLLILQPLGAYHRLS